MAIAICDNPDCERIFYGDELKNLNIFRENAKLPCGHNISHYIFGASAIRDAKKAEEKFEKIKPFLDILKTEYCAHCCYEDDDCNENPISKKCNRMKYE